jgi:molybdopterin converting factor subunit 1
MSNHARVLFFATLRDISGTRELNLEFLEGSRVSDIKSLVLQKYPALQKNMDTIIVAMNHEFAFDEQIVVDGAEVAMFPPVSGGEGDETAFPTIVALVDDLIDINKLVTKITLPTTGAVSVFTGTVREFTKRGTEKHTEYLIYDAYQAMAIEKMEQIAREIRSRWDTIEGIALVQRTGKLLPGMISVVIACSASHRDTGIFEAAKYGIDRLKEIVPVWKKEVSLEGEAWIEGEYIPQKGE